MSVLPLGPSDAGKASSKPRDIRGTVNIPFGYRLSQPGQTRGNVNSSRVKQSRFPDADKSSSHPRKYTSSNVEEVKPSDEYPSKSVEKKETIAKVSAKNGLEATTRTKVPTEKEAGKFVRAKVSLNGEKGRKTRQGFPSKEEKPASILPGNMSPTNDEEIAKDERENNSFLRTFHFVERTNKRILSKKFRNLFDEGLAEYEKSIDARREKLREMILTEDRAVTREIIEQAQRGAELRSTETQKRTEALRERLEEQRLATVTEKRMRQYLTQCPEARNKFTRKTTLETKYSNLVQIAEKEAKRQADREIDVLWYELMLKEIEAKKSREVEEERRRLMTGKSIVTTLDKQIAGKLALGEEERRIKEEEREHLAKLLESVRKEESSNPAREREKRLKLRRDLEEQLLTAKRYLVERAREEEAAERAFRVFSEAELSRERAETRESTSRLRAEIVAYMTSLEELREEEARRNAEIETIVASSAKEIEAQRDQARKKSRDERERSLRELLDGREQQLRSKRATIEEENRRSALEDELRRTETEAESELEIAAETRRRENARRYGQELKAQVKYDEERRRRECEENERIQRENQERDGEYEKLTEQLLNAPEIITPHAFKVMLKECADRRREAEQKGLCCCPR